MTGDLASLDARARAAALDAAAAHGLDASAARVVADGSNLVVHLAPSPVVARVATTTALVRRDPLAFAAREVDVAAFLAAAGAPVVAPASSRAEEHRGLAVTLWPFVDAEPARRLSVDEVRPRLAALHDALAAYPGPLPFLAPALDDTAAALDAALRLGALDAALVRELRAAHDALAPALIDAFAAGARPLHGDAHAKNLFVLADGRCLWGDFEDACAGPPAWDEMCLLRRTPPPRASLPADVQLLLDARRLQAVPWIALHALRFPARVGVRDVEQAVAAFRARC